VGNLSLKAGKKSRLLAVSDATRQFELNRRLAAFIWRHGPGKKQLAKPQSASTSGESPALSRELKKQGWKFVGPTTVHAFMQAMGPIDDHVED
jgi:DNA-3-methyladenine glycosylase I